MHETHRATRTLVSLECAEGQAKAAKVDGDRETDVTIFRPHCLRSRLRFVASHL